MLRAMRDLPASIPPPALVLGLAGLIPFVAIPLLIAGDASIWLPTGLKALATIPALTFYAAIILSFMGGAQWGLAMRLSDLEPTADWRRYTISVLPALIAWSALLVDARSALSLMAAAFAVLLAYDLWTVKLGEAPRWYASLRMLLTTVVVIMLTVTGAFLL
ncbi:MAG: DUF3429 domain-containing protein [Pseudomonadota bacterium]